MSDNDAARVTLVAGGGSVYVFDAGDDRIAEQVMVLDIAYPGEDIGQFTIAADAYGPKLIETMRANGMTVLDFRRSAVQS